MSPEEARDRLADCRGQIDQIDLNLLALLNERTQVVERIGEIKRSVDLPIYEPKREVAVLNNVLDNNPGPLPPDAVKRIFERVIDEMRSIQRLRMLGGEPK
jgi:chorismate mutase